MNNKIRKIFEKRTFEIYASFLISTVAGIITYIMIYEIFRLHLALNIASGLLVFVLFLLWLFSKLNYEEGDVKKEKTIDRYLRTLAIQKTIAVIAAVLLGVSATLVAGRTITQATETSASLTTAMPSTDQYRVLTEQLGDIFTLSRFNGSPDELAALDLIRDKIIAQMSEIESSGRLDAEREFNSESKAVDSAFLFQFFSNIFVRIGTIAILLYLLSILVREYRKLDKRNLELQLIKLAEDFEVQGVNIDAIRKFRSVLRINDSPSSIDASISDTALSDSFIDSTLSKPKETLIAILEAVKSKSTHENEK